MSNLIDYLTANAPHIAGAFWNTLGEMAPYLLFGFLFAGLLSVLISPEAVERHLGGRGLLPVVKAAAFGVPLPLCSCSVIPVSASLSRHGASKGAVVSFLLSTPQTGVDSIFVTFGMLGPVVAVYRPIAALASGILGGWAADVFAGEKDAAASANGHDEDNCAACSTGKGKNRLVRILEYGFVTLPADIGKALLAGLLISAMITALLPKDYFSTVLPPGPLQMLVLMAVGIPIYVCATASIPIAAALIVAGVSPGAAFAFLVTGPAVNAATIATVWKILGRRSCLIYLLVIVISAVGGGVILDSLVTPSDIIACTHDMTEMAPAWLGPASATVLLALLAFGILRPVWARFAGDKKSSDHDHGDADGHDHASDGGEELTLRITGMTCGHCVAAVEKALRNCPGVTAASVDLAAGIACVRGQNLDAAKLIDAVRNLGYAASVNSP